VKHLITLCFTLVTISSYAVEGYSSIAIKTVGAVSPELVTRIAGWVAQQIAPVTNAGSMMVNEDTLDAITTSEISSSAKTATVSHVTLILVEKLKTDARHSLSKPGVAVVNVGVLQPSDMRIDSALETLSRRVEKESVGGIALAFGLPVCPIFQCALYSALTLDELDHKGRGLCPPCAQKLEERMKQAGLMQSVRQPALKKSRDTPEEAKSRRIRPNPRSDEK
jgi:predicted Zn-dependent protease